MSLCREAEGGGGGGGHGKKGWLKTKQQSFSVLWFGEWLIQSQQTGERVWSWIHSGWSWSNRGAGSQNGSEFCGEETSSGFCCEGGFTFMKNTDLHRLWLTTKVFTKFSGLILSRRSDSQSQPFTLTFTPISVWTIDLILYPPSTGGWTWKSTQKEQKLKNKINNNRWLHWVHYLSRQ